MNNPVKDSTCYDIVIVENDGPLLENPVGSDEDGTALVSCGYHLEKQVGSLLVDGDVTEFVDAQKAWCGVFSECGIEGSCGVGCGEIVDDIDRSGEFNIDAAAACVMGQGDSQMGFAQSDCADKDDIFFFIDKVEFEKIPYFRAIDFFWMAPLKGVEGFNEWQSGDFDASVNSPLKSGLSFNFKQS